MWENLATRLICIRCKSGTSSGKRGEEERLLSTCCVPKCKGGKRTASCGFPHIRKLLFSFSSPADRDLFIWFSCAKTRVCSLQCRNYQVKRACKNHGRKEKWKTPMTFSSLSSSSFSFDTLPDNTKNGELKARRKREFLSIPGIDKTVLSLSSPWPRDPFCPLVLLIFERRKKTYFFFFSI